MGKITSAKAIAILDKLFENALYLRIYDGMPPVPAAEPMMNVMLSSTPISLTSATFNSSVPEASTNSMSTPLTINVSANGIATFYQIHDNFGYVCYQGDISELGFSDTNFVENTTRTLNSLGFKFNGFSV